MSEISGIGSYIKQWAATWGEIATNKNVSPNDIPLTDAALMTFGAPYLFAAGAISNISCAGASQEFCPSGNTGPIFPRDVPAFEPQTYRLEELLVNGLPVTWKFKVTNCDGTLNGVKVRVHFDQTDPADYIDVEPDADGNVTIQKTFNKLLPGPFFAEVSGVDQNSGDVIEPTELERIKLYMPRALPIDQIISIAGPFSADPGEEVTLTAQVTNISGSNLSVEYQWFIPNVGNPEGTVTLENGEAAIPTTFSMNDPGDYTIGIAIRLKDASGEIIAEGVKTHSFSVSEGNLCYSNPVYGRIEPAVQPDIINGSNEERSWTIYDVTDCEGLPILLENISLDPNSPLYDYDIERVGDAGIMIRGKIIPNSSGSAIVNLIDSEGRTNQITLGTPTIRQPQLLLGGDLYLIQVNAGELLPLRLLNDVPGATNYEYIVKDVNGDVIDEAGHSDPASSVWNDYTPQTNHRTIILQITTDEGSAIEIEKTINVVEPESVCFSGPISGTVNHEPARVTVQGSDTPHEWSVTLTDCYGEPVDLANVSADFGAYLYDADEPRMEGNLLIVSGKLRSDLSASGAIPVTVDDGDGVGANSTVYLSFSVEEPRLLINGNEFIDQLEPGREYILGLFAEVSGASYQYYLQAADGTETVISDPLHFIPARGGRQTIVLRITTGDPAHPIIEVEKEITVTCPITYDSATVSALDESGQPVSAAYQCISPTQYSITGLRNQCDDPLSTISLRAQFRDGSPDLIIPSLSDGALPVRRVLLAQSPQTTFAFTNARGERVEINWYGQPTVIQGRSGLPTQITFNVNGQYAASHQYSMMYGETATLTANPSITGAAYRWRMDGLLLAGETSSSLLRVLEPPFVPYNHLIALNAEVPITAPDGTLCYTQYISGGSQTINVFDPEALINISPAFGSDGQIPRRQVTLNAGILTSVALGDLAFSWEVTDPDGNPVTVAPVAAGNNQRVNFTPLQSGIYNLTLYVDNAPGSTRLSRQVVKRGQVTIGAFPDAKVEIEGESYPVGGATYPYRSVILPSEWRAFGPEDRNASCRFRVYHLDASGRPFPDSTTTQACVAAGDYPALTYGSINVPLPAVSEETNYYIDLTVTGQDGSYELSETKTVHVQPAAAAEIAADFTVTTPYAERIPYRAVNLRARPLDGAANYRWQIIARDYEPADPVTIIDEGPENETNYTFTESGVYTLRLEVENSGGDVIGAIEEDVEIYPFPPAQLEINVNNENPVFAGRSVLLISGLNRSGGLLPEDNNAAYAWTIRHRAPDPGDPTQTITINDLEPTDPRAQNPVVPFTFPQSGTYEITSTVTGRNGANPAYSVSDAETVTVYTPTVAPLALSLDNPPFAAEIGEEVSFNVINLDPAYTYSYNYGDAVSDATGRHAYDNTGPKTVVVTAANLANSDIVFHITHVITIVPLGAPVPNFTLNPGNGPSSAAAPLAVTINGAGSRIDRSGPATPTWYFSIDGTEWAESFDGTLTAIFTDAGNHSIEMYVVDSNGIESSHITASVPTWAP